MEDSKNINDKDLEKVSSGLAFAQFRQELLSKLPSEVRCKLAKAKSDNEACAIIAENSINYEAIEEEMRDFFAKYTQDMRKLNDQELEAIAGGFESGDYGEVTCWCCKASNRDDFSYQFWASTFLTSGRIYRCKKCGSYQVNYTSGNVWCMPKEEYDKWLNDKLDFDLDLNPNKQ